MEGVDGAVAVTYCPQPVTPLPHTDLYAAIAVQMRTCGVSLIDALCVGADGWASYIAPHQHGEAIDNAKLPDQPRPRADQKAGVQLPPSGKKAQHLVQQALREIEKVLKSMVGSGREVDQLHPQAISAVETLDDMASTWDRALDLTNPIWECFDMALVLWALGNPGIRDTVLATWCHGIEAGERALQQQLAWRDDGAKPDGPLFLAGEGPRPSAARLMMGLELTRQLASLSSGVNRAGCLATAGWLSWALGSGTHAHAYAEHALRLDPSHGLAGIVRDLSTGGHLPPWAFADPGQI